MRLLTPVALIWVCASSVARERHFTPKLPSPFFDTGTFADEDANSPSLAGEDNHEEISNFLQLLPKRSLPRWYQGYAYKAPSLHASPPLFQSKRFLPFHPLARFRGLSLGGGSGGGAAMVGSSGIPYGQGSFDTFVSDSSLVPSPGHPVPSGETTGLEMSSDEELHPVGPPFVSPPVSPAPSRINAGDILRMLTSGPLSDSRGSSPPRGKIFRFGIKK